jgi:NAD(P)-dependent dehydrogenase (short-subunit alcohol dehydrogenase family)
MPLISTSYGMHTTADEVVAGVDLAGLRAVVTGASSGIGVETARSLSRAGAEVTLAVRDTDAGARVAHGIAATTGNREVRVGHLDLADLPTIAAFLDTWDGPLHLLINNAGIMAGPLERTPQGWELQFATNHLGHFALALGLHDALAAGAAGDDRIGGARIVSVSSSGHLGSPVLFDDIQFERRPYDEWAAYGQSKTANVLFAVEATRRWSGDGIVANALMPGGIATGLQKHIPQSVRDGYLRQAEAGEIFMKTTQQGAATTLVAATSPEFAGSGGHYLEDGNEVPVIANNAEVPPTGGVRQWAVDPEAATRLWSTSVTLLEQAVS